MWEEPTHPQSVRQASKIMTTKIDYQFADLLKEYTSNNGCEGVRPDVRFAVATLSRHERGKLVAELARQGYIAPTNAPTEPIDPRDADDFARGD